ncbi:MAG: vitamin K epoxide reductase [Chloroflexales bacterium]|nr:vitamin K epoxide reductase [Chloroflexales bacterium]
MKRKRLHKLLALWSALILLSVQHTAMVAAESPIVHAVLFYSPACGHCHVVITEVLPPLSEQYGDQLQIVGVNTAEPEGQTLYQAAIERFDIPAERRGVPTLILAETVLVGSLEIPEQLPALIEEHLAAGGVDWPAIPGLAAGLLANESAAGPTPASSPDQAPDPASDPDAIAPLNGPAAASAPAADDLMSKLQRDPVGNALSILLLAGMLVVVGYVLNGMRRAWHAPSKGIFWASARQGWRGWAVALLCLVGLGVSVYMAYVETTHTTAVCGPIGDCNTVQQSPYAALFGLIPIGVLGVLGYATMLAAWAGMHWGRGRFRSVSGSALFGMALFGTLFSIYLTFLEPFVIGATCLWCLTSAVSITLILYALAGSMPLYTRTNRRGARA